MRLEHANISSTHTEELTRFIQTAFPDFRIRGEGAGTGGRPCRYGISSTAQLTLRLRPLDPIQ